MSISNLSAGRSPGTGMTTPSTRLVVRVEWLDAPGVVTPELAATWAQYEIWVGSACVTMVETADQMLRRSVHGSLYPLACWIGSNWQELTTQACLPMVDARYWTYRNLRAYPWLRQHNLRCAGDGMPWPDLTIVPEGATTRLAWSPDACHRAPIRFVSAGHEIVQTDVLRADLAMAVDQILERLAESGLPMTPVTEDWPPCPQDANGRRITAPPPCIGRVQADGLT